MDSRKERSDGGGARVLAALRLTVFHNNLLRVHRSQIVNKTHAGRGGKQCYGSRRRVKRGWGRGYDKSSMNVPHVPPENQKSYPTHL